MNDTAKPCARGCEVPGRHAITHPTGSACPGCLPRPAMRGTTVCEHCADLFHNALRDLAITWPDLTTGVARDRSTSTAGGSRVHTSRIADIGDYWRPLVTNSMNDITRWIEFVHQALADTPVRGLRGFDLLQLPPGAALSLLAREARRILLEHPEAAEGLVRQALQLRGRAHRALSTTYDRRIPLKDPAARCLAEVEHDDPDAEYGIRVEPCTAALYAVLKPADSGGESAILCSRFPVEHAIPASQWGALADELEAITS